MSEQAVYNPDGLILSVNGGCYDPPSVLSVQPGGCLLQHVPLKQAPASRVRCDRKVTLLTFMT